MQYPDLSVEIVDHWHAGPFIRCLDAMSRRDYPYHEFCKPGGVYQHPELVSCRVIMFNEHDFNSLQDAIYSSGKYTEVFHALDKLRDQFDCWHYALPVGLLLLNLEFNANAYVYSLSDSKYTLIVRISATSYETFNHEEALECLQRLNPPDESFKKLELEPTFNTKPSLEERLIAIESRLNATEQYINTHARVYACQTMSDRKDDPPTDDIITECVKRLLVIAAVDTSTAVAVMMQLKLDLPIMLQQLTETFPVTDYRYPQAAFAIAACWCGAVIQQHFKFTYPHADVSTVQTPAKEVSEPSS